MRFRIKALGSLVVVNGDGPMGGAATQRRTLALLVLIAAAGNRGVSRDKLIGLLWPDTTEERARHAFAQTLYRLRQQFGGDAVDGTDMLRVNSAIVAYDVADFEDAIARSDLEEAVRLYEGHFLDGFVLPGAPDFERRVEEERARLMTAHRDLLQRLARVAADAGLHSRAAEWWRALASADPLNSRVAARYVEALVAAGDRAAALQYGHVHEMLIRHELNAAPTAEFLDAIAAARRERPHGIVPSTAVAANTAASPADPSSAELPARPDSAPFEHTNENFRFVVPRRFMHRGAALAGLLVATVGLAYARLEDRAAGTPVIAVGFVADYTGAGEATIGRILPEMLTTNLSRIRGIHVVHRARLHELMLPERDSIADAGDFARAAGKAGVDQLLDGALYRKPDGALRFDVRLVDLRTGHVKQIHRMEGSDAFALADSATLRLAAALGLSTGEALRVADVTTSSLIAYGFYEEGMRALRSVDRISARRLFDAALDADSTFAMAAFGMFQALYPSDGATALRYLERAQKLAARATERERLIINAMLAHWVDSPSRVAVAESLATRYPADPQSHQLLAQALQWSGDFRGALVAARQVVAMDSAGQGAPRCLACEALDVAVVSHRFMDSLDAADSLARDWARRDPISALPWIARRDLATGRDDTAGASAAHGRVRALMPLDRLDEYSHLVALAVRSGKFSLPERLAAPILESGSAGEKAFALWWTTISLRHQGRSSEAIAMAQRMRRVYGDQPQHRLLYAQTLREAGKFHQAAALFDSIAAIRRHDATAHPSQRARHEGWALTQMASALAAAGDVSRLPALADSIQRLGRRSGYGRDPLLHHHVRGLLLQSQRKHEEAIAEFRSAMWSPVAGYTRTNFELGRILIDLGRPLEAIPVLRAALHGGLEASSLYVTQTELRALLARAHAAAHRADSAAIHRRWVEHAVRAGDEGARKHILALIG